MSLLDPCLIRSQGPAGQLLVLLGMPLVDEYLEFLEGRCRPNTVLAAAYDLRVFFAVIDKPAAAVRPADVLGFITAQRTGRPTAIGVQVSKRRRGVVSVAMRKSPLFASCRTTAGEPCVVTVAVPSSHRSPRRGLH